MIRALIDGTPRHDSVCLPEGGSIMLRHTAAILGAGLSLGLAGSLSAQSLPTAGPESVGISSDRLV